MLALQRLPAQFSARLLPHSPALPCQGAAGLPRSFLSCAGKRRAPRAAAMPCCSSASGLPGGQARGHPAPSNGSEAGSGLPAHLLGGVPGFSDVGAAAFSMAIIGDLHLEPDQMGQFRAARAQLRQAVEADGDASGPVAPRVVQLGDLGGYEHEPGALLLLTPACRLPGSGARRLTSSTCSIKLLPKYSI